ncbi:MAG: OprO/OprP family phosphate-selective porin [Alphaproteobacteria bacterium]|jgi:phosphate-selective porin OprO/OprP
MSAAALMAITTAEAQTATTVTTTTVHKHKHHHRTVVKTKTTVTSAASGGAAAPFVAAPPLSADGNPSLEERVRRLEEQLDAQREKDEAEHTRLTTLEQNFNETSWSFDNLRPVIKSGDGRFSLAFRVRFQVDAANFFQKDPHDPNNMAQFKDLSDGAVVRRAFLGVEGKAFNDFWYEFRYNGGGSNGGGINATEGDPVVSLARVAYLGVPNFELNAGVIEPAFMFEGTTSSGQLMFLERPEIDNIAADSFGAGDARRGIEARYQRADLLMPGDNLVLGADFTGGKTGSIAGHGNGGDEQSQILAHGSYRPWSDGISNVSLGADYSHAFTGGGVGTINLQDRPQVRVDGDRLVSTGSIFAKTADMWAANAGANFENFFLGGEYAHFSVDRAALLGGPTIDNPSFSGWYVEGSWVITGEPKSYTVSATNNEVGGFGAPKVASPFSFSGDSWGAWELTARYSNTDLNWNQNAALLADGLPGIAGGEERIAMFGLNWYLNNNIKLQVNDGIVHVSKLNAPGGTIQVGQNFNELAVRLQFTN